jgi:hypothetical protein
VSSATNYKRRFAEAQRANFQAAFRNAPVSRYSVYNNQKKELFLAAMFIGQMERNGETL